MQKNDATFCCWQPLDVELHDAQSRTYGLKAQVGVIGGVLPGFVTRIHKDSVRRWNLWFPSAGVFAKVLAGRATGTQITFPPIMSVHCTLIIWVITFGNNTWSTANSIAVWNKCINAWEFPIPFHNKNEAGRNQPHRLRPLSGSIGHPS